MQNTFIHPRVRFAPSPTGYIHLGGLRTYLFDYLIAKKYSGTLILRIEDTDTNRFVPGATESFIKLLHDFELVYDEGPFLKEDGTIEHKGPHGPYIQSERLDIYKQHADILLAEEKAYICFCTPERLDELRKHQEINKLPPMYDRRCCALSHDEVRSRIAAGEPHVIRFKIPEGETTYTDLLRGEITVQNVTIDDQVLMKANGYPTYHLAAMVDDHLMGITHVTRAEEWLPSTPKHVLIHQAFGWTPPYFLHFPLLLDAQRKKLSKRAMDVSVTSIMSKGYLREALINFIALLGWHPSDDREIFSLPELEKEFSVERMQKAGAIFVEHKLDWVNAQHLRALPQEKLIHLFKEELAKSSIQANDIFDNTHLGYILDTIKDRLQRLPDLVTESALYFEPIPLTQVELLLSKNTSKESTLMSLRWMYNFLSHAEVWTPETLKESCLTKIESEKLNRGEVLWPSRVALTGREKSPDVFLVAHALGKNIALQRMKYAIEKLESL